VGGRAAGSDGLEGVLLASSTAALLASEQSFCAAIVQGTRTPPSHGGNPGSNPGSGIGPGPDFAGHSRRQRRCHLTLEGWLWGASSPIARREPSTVHAPIGSRSYKMSCDKSSIRITLEHFWIVDFVVPCKAGLEPARRGQPSVNVRKIVRTNGKKVRDASRLKRLDP
jgi:hypothetical protein